MEANFFDVKKCIKRFLLPALFLVLILINCFSLVKEFPQKVPLYRFDLSNQTMYLPEYLEDGRHPDAFLREFVRDKKVKFYTEFRTYESYRFGGEPEYTENKFQYYIDNNYGYFFREFSGDYEIDPGVPRPYTVTHSENTETWKNSFTYLGPSNDMLRYSFAANDDHDMDRILYYKNNYFHYAWNYMGSYERRAYISLDDPDAETWIACWDLGENLYLMSEDRFNIEKSREEK